MPQVTVSGPLTDVAGNGATRLRIGDGSNVFHARNEVVQVPSVPMDLGQFVDLEEVGGTGSKFVGDYAIDNSDGTTAVQLVYRPPGGPDTVLKVVAASESDTLANYEQTVENSRVYFELVP
jgi:hypothetical protein